MAPKKTAVTSKALRALLTRIGSASSGTKSTLIARFQRDIQRSGLYDRQCGRKEEYASTQHRKLRVVSIDMGIKNLAFCDAEVSHSLDSKHGFDAHMHVLRWKKLDLMSHSDADSARFNVQDSGAVAGAADEEGERFSPSVLSKTAYNLVVKEVLSARPDIVLIEKQRWRSGGGSAVQQWTVRVNTLEAMLWAVLETVKQTRLSLHGQAPAAAVREYGYRVYAVDPKRVGQYWLGQHARALQERHADTLALDDIALSTDVGGSGDVEDEVEEEELGKVTKKPSRSKAEKSAKIAVLRSWLADEAMSSVPSTPSSMPRIAFSIDAAADSTRQALLPKSKAPRQKKSSRDLAKDAAALLDEIPAAEIKKLDDITDCFLQAAAWVAWESNRLQLKGMSGDRKVSQGPVGEEQILEMIKHCGEI
ncbi:hypothetical protein E8E13_011651 [Curvularia kusanoi]|uniref:SAP domain-containing protein n=1 Tax=Curvularia kusanoi TaxID=90978 RepID=A0A9P4WF11_CURKU|nr:hypothetical protein E8E13_011651 [Curvularia kusanoi]